MYHSHLCAPARARGARTPLKWLSAAFAITAAPHPCGSFFLLAFLLVFLRCLGCLVRYWYHQLFNPWKTRLLRNQP